LDERIRARGGSGQDKGCLLALIWPQNGCFILACLGLFLAEMLDLYHGEFDPDSDGFFGFLGPLEFLRLFLFCLIEVAMEATLEAAFIPF
jgi:hypothetical protein